MKSLNQKAEQRSEVMQHILTMYEQRGDALFNKVSARFSRVKDILSFTRGQIDHLLEGIENIEKEALGKVQYIILDNHPRHGLSEEADRKVKEIEKNLLSLGIGNKQKNSLSSKVINTQCQEIIQEIADVTLDVIDKKVNTFIELLSSNVDQVNAKIEQLIRQTNKKNVFKSNFDPVSKSITNRDTIWVDYEGITLTQNDKLLFEKSSRTAFNKINVDLTRDIILESEKNRDGECTISDVKSALQNYQYSPSYLELRLSELDKIKEKDVNKVLDSIRPFFNLEELFIDFSNWQFSIFEDENRYISNLSEMLKSLPALHVLHLNISKMKSEQCDSDVDIVDDTMYKFSETINGLKLIYDLNLNFEELKSSLTSNSFEELMKAIGDKKNLKYLALNFGEWCDLNYQMDSYDCLISLSEALRQTKKLISLDLNLISQMTIERYQKIQTAFFVKNLNFFYIGNTKNRISYEDKSYSKMLINIAKNLYLNECDIKSISVIGYSSFSHLEDILREKAEFQRNIIVKLRAINLFYAKSVRKEIIWDILKRPIH